LLVPSLEKQCENALKARESLNESKVNGQNGEDAVRLLPDLSNFNLETSIKEKSKYLSSWSQDMSTLCQWNNYMQSKQSVLQSNENIFSDIEVTILDEDKKVCAIFPCHRVILARVPYFRAVMRRTTNSSGFIPSKSIFLDDADPQDVYTILEFVYTGTVNPLGERLLPLLALASRLCMTRLMSRLQNIIATVAGHQDASTLLETADALRLPRLLRLAKALSNT
jgi:BTB/POZ domain